MNIFPTFDKYTFHKMKDLTDTHRYLKKRIIELDNSFYMIFSYIRDGQFSTSYERECRGSMFKVTKDGNYIDSVCRPFEKFFEHSQIERNKKWKDTLYNFYGHINDDSEYKIFEKLDGSIISSFIHEDKLRFKSNNSLKNEHIDAAVKYISENPSFKNTIEDITRQGFTITFELTSPNFKIVIPYKSIKLTILAIRSVKNGVYWDYEEIIDIFGENHVVKQCHYDLESIKEIKCIEGFVILYENMLRVKYKTNWYLEKEKKPSNFGKKVIDLLESNSIDNMTNDSLELSVLKKLRNFIENTFNKIVEKNTIYLDNKSFMSNFKEDKLQLRMAALYRFHNIRSKNEITNVLASKDQKSLCRKIKEWKKELLVK